MSVKFSILGGAGEIGMNMYLYESEQSAVLVDCGVMFPDNSFPGVDFIIPDFTYLSEIRHKIKGIVLSHGHEDHIGALPYLLKQFPMTVYGGPLTIRLLESKLKESHIQAPIHVFNDNDELSFDDFKVRLLPVNHSISDTHAIHILHDDIKCLHVSDFKIDQSPVNGKPFSPEIFLNAAKEGIDCLVSDSTNVLNENFTPSESSVKKDIKDIMMGHNGRVFFTTFASNIDRLQQLVEICEEVGRKIVFEGRSIVKNVEIAKSLAYIRIPDGVEISLAESRKYKADDVCYVISGCQGERQSTFYKVVSKERRSLVIQEGDLFVISARVIPGNEKNLNETINNIYLNGGHVVDIQKKRVHVSGHASAEELKLLMNLTKPDYLVPVHGEYFHLKEHVKLGINSGFIQPDCSLFCISGDQLIFEKGKLLGRDQVPFGRRFVDRRGDFQFGEALLRHRKHLSRDGMVIIQYSEEAEGVLASLPLIHTEGFALNPMQQTGLQKHIMENLPLLSGNINEEMSGTVDMVKQLAKSFFKKQLDRRPVVAVINVEDM